MQGKSANGVTAGIVEPGHYQAMSQKCTRCNNITRDPSGLCHHHSRSSAILQSQPSPGSLLPSSALTSLEGGPSDWDLQAAAIEDRPPFGGRLAAEHLREREWFIGDELTAAMEFMKCLEDCRYSPVEGAETIVMPIGVRQIYNEGNGRAVEVEVMLFASLHCQASMEVTPMEWDGDQYVPMRTYDQPFLSADDRFQGADAMREITLRIRRADRISKSNPSQGLTRWLLYTEHEDLDGLSDEDISMLYKLSG